MKKFKVRLIVDKTYEVKAKSAFDAEHEAWHWLSFDINEKGRAEVEEVNEAIVVDGEELSEEERAMRKKLRMDGVGTCPSCGLMTKEEFCPHDGFEIDKNRQDGY